MSFAAAFSIASPGGGYTDAGGTAQVAPADTPRFDHAAGGAPRGLLVQGAPEAAAADVVTLNPGVVANYGCTILHQYQRPDQTIVSRAWWSTRPTETVNALLNTKGWHRSLIVVNRALPVVDGVVTFRGVAYQVGALLAVDPAMTELLAVGDAQSSTLTGAES